MTTLDQPPGELVSKRAGARLLNVSPPMLDTLAARYPNFPKPIRLTPNGRWRYRAHELIVWARSPLPSSAK